MECAAGQRLVRVQAERTGVARDRGGLAAGADGCGVRTRGRSDDERRERWSGGVAADGRRRGRRGDRQSAAVVLLRGDRSGGRRGAVEGAGASGRLRPRPRGDRRGDHTADARRHRQLAAQPNRGDLSGGDAGTARPVTLRGVGALQAADLPPLGRGVLPDRLRRSRVSASERVVRTCS